MSFLIIGSDYIALSFAKIIKDFGWKVNVITKNYNNKKDLVLLPRVFYEEFFDDFDSLIKDLDFIEVRDLYDKKAFFETNSVLVDLNYYRNKIIKQTPNLKIYKNSELIDKNGENIFIKENGRGIMLKAKYVLNFEDEKLALNKPTFEKTEAVLEINSSKNNRLFFTENNYGMLIHLINNKYFVFVFGKNTRFSLNDFISKNNAKLLAVKTKHINLYNSKNKFFENDVFYLSDVFGLTNNLIFSGKRQQLLFLKNNKTFFNNIFASKKDFNNELKNQFSYLEDLRKKADIFWSSNMVDKNKFIKKLNLKDFALDFNSMFNNLSLKYKLKMVFR